MEDEYTDHDGQEKEQQLHHRHMTIWTYWRMYWESTVPSALPTEPLCKWANIRLSLGPILTEGMIKEMKLL